MTHFSEIDENVQKDLHYAGMVFDDFIHPSFDNSIDVPWSQICIECEAQLNSLYQKDSKIIHYIENHGSGICGVKGCDNSQTSYINFLDGFKLERGDK